MHSCASKYTVLSLVLDKSKTYEDSELFFFLIEIERYYTVEW